MALRRRVVDRQRLVVGSHRFLKLIEHVESITQIVVSRCIVCIELDSSVISFNGLVILRLHAKGITKVIVGLRFLRVKLDGSLVMLDCLIDDLVQIKRVTQVIMNV